MFVRHVLGIKARIELYLRFDSSGTEIGISREKNVFHGFHGSIVEFTGPKNSLFHGPVTL